MATLCLNNKTGTKIELICKKRPSLSLELMMETATVVQTDLKAVKEDDNPACDSVRKTVVLLG